MPVLDTPWCFCSWKKNKNLGHLDNSIPGIVGAFVLDQDHDYRRVALQ